MKTGYEVSFDMQAIGNDAIPTNLAEAETIKPYVLQEILERKVCSCAVLYENLSCCDIPLYIALHDLLAEGYIKGPDPYAWNCPTNHQNMIYRIKLLTK